MKTFNVKQYQHDIELRHNVCLNEIHDMESKKVPFDEKTYDSLYELKEQLEDLIDTIAGCYPIAFLPDTMWKLANDTVMWAENYRGR